MPYIGDLGVLSKLLAFLIGDVEPIDANERIISDAVSVLHESIDNMEKKVKSAREAITESECEKFKVCSEMEAKLGELRKELDGGDFNSIELRLPEIISEIEQLIAELEKLLMEEEEEEEEEEDE